MTVLLGDVQGSAQVAIAADGTVTRNAYTPYGVTRGTDALVTERGWLGQVEDDTTGLTYLNARYYDPAVGRFLSPDPLMSPGDPRTLDPYRYADNNPVSYTDASGLKPDCGATTKCQAYNNAPSMNDVVQGVYHPPAKPDDGIAAKWDSGKGDSSQAVASVLPAALDDYLPCGVGGDPAQCIVDQGRHVVELGRSLNAYVEQGVVLGRVVLENASVRRGIAIASHLESLGPTWRVIGTAASLVDSHNRLTDTGLSSELNSLEQAAFVVLRAAVGEVGGQVGAQSARTAAASETAGAAVSCSGGGPIGAGACGAAVQFGASAVGGVAGDAAATWAFDRAVETWGRRYLDWRPWKN
ncbi:RHS repeat-associated core domain-containing protein [Demequina activiva]|uniref:Teneurin-like YD-shell domain-containing protein n=1 Tax=Demequina activiva TaxID=1582364 RepID=A0A919UHL6_9MICO|nr:RHS repeat-associated core domain-containing protein [Demequina activiva]GIG55599.1 hypothetical protein Dac01nite_23510 [Demequina activiva]